MPREALPVFVFRVLKPLDKLLQTFSSEAGTLGFVLLFLPDALKYLFNHRVGMRPAAEPGVDRTVIRYRAGVGGVGGEREREKIEACWGDVEVLRKVRGFTSGWRGRGRCVSVAH